MIKPEPELPADVDRSRNAWATPQSIYAPLDTEFGFTIDASAEEHNTKCPIYITPQMDALKTDWIAFAKERGVKPIFWLNPPYSSNLLGKFMHKAFAESRRGARVVCLVPPSTGAKWWHQVATQGEIRYIEGRIKFVPPPGTDDPGRPRGDCVLIIFRGPEEL